MVFPITLKGKIRFKQNGDFKKLDQKIKKAIQTEFYKIKVERMSISNNSIEFEGGMFRKVTRRLFAWDPEELSRLIGINKGKMIIHYSKKRLFIDYQLNFLGLFILSLIFYILTCLGLFSNIKINLLNFGLLSVAIWGGTYGINSFFSLILFRFRIKKIISGILVENTPHQDI